MKAKTKIFEVNGFKFEIKVIILSDCFNIHVEGYDFAYESNKYGVTPADLERFLDNEITLAGDWTTTQNLPDMTDSMKYLEENGYA